MRRGSLIAIVLSTSALVACRGGGALPGAPVTAFPGVHARSALAASGRLGALLTSRTHGQIYGFDVDQTGTDGVLATAKNTQKPGSFTVDVETFDQNTGSITGAFANQTGTVNSYAVDRIFVNDVALVTHYIVPKGQIYAKRVYEVMNPVTKQAFTGKWTPPVADIDVQQAGINQQTHTDVLFASELRNNDTPVLVVSDVQNNTFSKMIPLDPNRFGGAYSPMMGQYILKNQAVIAYSPDGGAAGGKPPVNAIVDLSTGALTSFPGYNNGPYHAGSINGAAVDPNTGIEATTTELNAQVEFYDVNRKSAVAFAQLPCTGSADQGSSAAGIAVDAIHHLFLVTEPFNACAGNGSAVHVYTEKGQFVETIPGFAFVIAEPAPVLVPSKRMGWTFGPGVDQLQQFYY